LLCLVRVSCVGCMDKISCILKNSSVLLCARAQEKQGAGGARGAASEAEEEEFGGSIILQCFHSVFCGQYQRFLKGIFPWTLSFFSS
jgi:hypothetical protein